MQKLKNIIKESGLSNPKLSIKLGHSRKYLTNLLNDGCSTELQNRLINEISEVIAGTFKTDAEVIAELTQRLAEVQDQKIELGKHWENSFNHQKKVAQAEIEKLHKANISLMQESDSYHNANTKLNAELNTMRKNAQEADRALKQAKDDLDYIKEENDQLRDSIELYNKEFEDRCNKVYLLDKKLKSEKLWTITFLILALVLSALVWFK